MTYIGPTNDTFSLIDVKTEARDIILRLHAAYLLSDALRITIYDMHDPSDSDCARAEDLRGNISRAMSSMMDAQQELEAVARWLPTR